MLFRSTRAEDVKIDSILGLETKALFTKDELDNRVEILVKYKEKKNNKDYLNITIERISNKRRFARSGLSSVRTTFYAST